jgi:alkanesulfonate monooxygenase SsuD/methylene tetrahydromethanopterin reductase-like flavin-dependent oxidoreductase (luciferase family)
LALAVANVGERYVTAERSAESIAQALCIAGTPEQCIRAVQERIDAGVEHINLGFLASEPDHFFHQMKMFAASVMPQFQS